jgi:hypothetical protein
MERNVVDKSERTRIREAREKWVSYKDLVDDEVGATEEIEFSLP